MSKNKKKNKIKNHHCYHILIEIPYLPDNKLDKLLTQIADVVYDFKYPKNIDPYVSSKKTTTCDILDIV